MENRVDIGVATDRLKTCYSCEFFSKETKTCDKCGCFMLLKVKVPSAECPVHKWAKSD